MDVIEIVGGCSSTTPMIHNFKRHGAAAALETPRNSQQKSLSLSKLLALSAAHCLPFFCRELKNVKSQLLQTKQTAKRL
jgi:hypothetical protein